VWRWMRGRRKRLSGPAEIPRALRHALIAVLEGDLDTAEDWLGRVAKADSDAAGTYLALARLYRRRGEFGRALQLHQSLLLRGDLSREERRAAQRGLAEDFRVAGFLQRAEAAYQELLSEAPNDRIALRGMIQVLDQSGKPGSALPLCLRLARLEGTPTRGVATDRWVAVARAEQRAGRAREARRAAQRAVRLERHHAGAWLVLGEVEAELGRTRRALSAWRRAADLDAEVAERVYPKLAAAFAALGRAREFETFLTQQIEAHPARSGARVALAQALGARGEAERGLEALAPLLSGRSADLAVHVARGRLLLDSGDAGACESAYAGLLDVLENHWLEPPPELAG
jgi:lipopolysaccharide biosynthesis regulator YciM